MACVVGVCQALKENEWWEYTFLHSRSGLVGFFCFLYKRCCFFFEIPFAFLLFRGITAGVKDMEHMSEDPSEVIEGRLVYVGMMRQAAGLQRWQRVELEQTS